MISPCERLTNFFNPFVSKSNDGASRKRKSGDSEASSLDKIVKDTLFPLVAPHNRTCHFQRLGSKVVAHSIGSFLAYRDLVSFCNTSKQLDSIREIGERLIFSRIPIFGKNEYKFYWGVEITDEFEPAKINKRVLRRFLKTYFGPNPVDPTKLVKDTCSIPTVVPVRVMVEGRSFNYNLNLLSDIVSHSGNDENAAIITYNGVIIEESGFKKSAGETSPQRPYLQIVLRKVIGHNECQKRQVQRLQALNEQTGYGCEAAGPDVLGLTTAELTENEVRGNLPFGDEPDIDMEYRTRSRTRGFIQRNGRAYSVIVSGFRRRLGPHDALTLCVGTTLPTFLFRAIGMAVQRKFESLELEP